MAAIHLKNVAHSYIESPKSQADFALKQLDHVWEDGGAYALLGPSGCGKTTLLNIISGLLKPSEGCVLFGEEDVTETDTSQRNIAQVFQFPVIYDTMTVRENLAFPLRNRGVPVKEIIKRVDEVAGMLGLGDQLDNRASGLSADMKQIISLGRGLVRSDVNAILFDEPLTVIDPHMKWVLRTKLKELHRQFGFTMVYVTHDQTEALTFADKVVVMHDGEVVQIGTPEELFAKPAHTFVGYFIGSPGMNVLPAKVDGNDAVIDTMTIKLTQSYGALSGDVEIGIRPEFLKLVPADKSDIHVHINSIEDVGRHKIARCQLGEQTLAVVVPENEHVPIGTMGIKFDPAHTHVYQNSRLIEGVS
ncbi:ABC transporter ATP-binding protein [Kordiimonas aquimaris]|uniref:ABC transporter ATP-binding protein n=1 Tax=Kordiimonas aquimaris TaxID=707591 RepID=UPI0021CE5DF4|nr:ABC transporter ATP-binding protein [Kordiimonas aquimaris]